MEQISKKSILPVKKKKKMNIDGDYGHGKLSAASLFVRFKNLKISLTVAHVVFSKTYIKIIHGQLKALAPNTL